MSNSDITSGNTGILICNLGTPDSCDTKDVRKFLKEFLWDPRVVKAPRVVWWLVLNLIILNTRPKRTAEAYKKVWTAEGSPLLTITRKQARELGALLDVPVEPAMRYGKPSMESAIEKLKSRGAEKLIVLPMYPQYSHTTTASTKDKALELLDKSRFHIVCDYHNHSEYISALADSVRESWESNERAEKLVMSFHGIPKEYADDGDPYRDQCETTASLLAQELGLGADQWLLTYQSRLGPKEWLRPYTDQTLQQLGREGVQSVDLICPGFSVDCLETLEEIAIQNRDIFLEAGGKNYNYIPCLNDSDRHMQFLAQLVQEILS